MKNVIVLVILAAAAWFGYRHLQSRDTVVEHIENPVFAEFRVTKKIPGREIEMALFGKMASDVDCRERGRRVWEDVIKGCADCAMTVSDCKTELPPRYARLFDNVRIPSTYVAFTRGDSGERDGRMVIWGVTADEGSMLCENIRAEFKKRYKGQVECVAARVD